MRGGFGLIGLVLALGMVAVVMYKQLNTVQDLSLQPSDALPQVDQAADARATGAHAGRTNVAEQSRQLQDQVRGQVEQVMQQRPRDVDAAIQ